MQSQLEHAFASPFRVVLIESVGQNWCALGNLFHEGLQIIYFFHMLRHIRREYALLHSLLKKPVLIRGEAAQKLHRFDALKALCKVILLLAARLPMLQEPLRLLRHVITIHEAIVGVVMAKRGHYDCELF